MSNSFDAVNDFFDFDTFKKPKAQKAVKAAPAKAVKPTPKTKKQPPQVKLVQVKGKAPQLSIVVPEPKAVKQPRSAKMDPVRKHVRQTHVNRRVRFADGTTGVLSFRRQKAGVVVKTRGRATIVVAQRPAGTCDESKSFKALVDFGAGATQAFYGANERQAFKRAASVAWSN